MSPRIVLVNPPHSEFDRSEIGPPLGLLRLAGTARACGWDVRIEDFNLQWHLDAGLRADFYSAAVKQLLAHDADVYGFTSMVVDSHIALELARRIKRERRNATIALGGTHFSSIAGQIIEAYRWIDVVVQRDGETDLSALLRDRGGIANRAPELSTDYAAVDFEPYFAVNPYRVADVESEKGCRFACSYCYSAGHYPQVRALDVDRFVAELAHLAGRGVRHVFLVQDNFLNDRARALEVCGAMEAARLELSWHCYATAPQLEPRVVVAMARAGCRAVFTGIDAVGQRSQRRYRKAVSRFAEGRISLCVEHGITPTCAFMVAPPSHDCGVDAEETVGAALAARALGAQVRLNTLTLYPGTPLFQNMRTRLEYDHGRIAVDLDIPEFAVPNPLALKRPDLFPFHARYTSDAEWSRFTQQVHALFTLVHARGEQLIEMHRGGRTTLFDIADAVLNETGELMAIDKAQRRRVEVEAFDSVYFAVPV